jgi:hypothetical protein
VAQPDVSTGPDAGRGSRRRSQWLPPREVDGRGSVATGNGGGAVKPERRPNRRGFWSLAVLVTLLAMLVTMVLAMASTFTLR